MTQTEPVLPEPSLRDVLNDSIVTLLMERDGVDHDQLCGLMRRIRRHMRRTPLPADLEEREFG